MRRVGRRTATFRANGSVAVDYYTRDGVLRGRADTALPGTIVYIHLGDTLVAQDAWQWRSPFGRTYFHTDHLGTPLARSDFTGTVFERTRRQSFGQPLVGPLKDGPGYTGHMEDPGTGLVYMQQRYYDPTIASFLSVDPVGPLSDPSNHFGRYHYAYNNPYKYVDPDGRFGISPSHWNPRQNEQHGARGQAMVADMKDRTQFEAEGAGAYGIGLRVKHDLVTDRTSAGFVFLGLGAHGKAGAAVGVGLDYRVGRLEWGKLDAPVDLEFNGAVGPIGLELTFDPGGRIDFNAGFNAGGGLYAGGSIMVDERVIDGSWRQGANGNGGSPHSGRGIEVVNVTGRIDSVRLREQDRKR